MCEILHELCKETIRTENRGMFLRMRETFRVRGHAGIDAVVYVNGDAVERALFCRVKTEETMYFAQIS